MKRATFEVKQSPAGGYYFTLRDPEDRTQVISCGFPDRAELEKGLAGVRDAAVVAEVRAAPAQADSLPCFVIRPCAGGVLFSLIGFRGELLFTSVPQADEARCRDAIGMLKALSQRAHVLDLTEE